MFRFMNRLDMDHECDRQTDERTDILTANATLLGGQKQQETSVRRIRQLLLGLQFL